MHVVIFDKKNYKNTRLLYNQLDKRYFQLVLIFVCYIIYTLYYRYYILGILPEDLILAIIQNILFLFTYF